MDSGRRRFMKAAAVAAVAGVAVTKTSSGEDRPAGRKFTICLACGTIGLRDEPTKVIGWAREFGFESIEPSAQFLGKLSDSELADYLGQMRDAKLTWGAAGVPVQFRAADES